jgi:hypothetical protein
MRYSEEGQQISALNTTIYNPIFWAITSLELCSQACDITAFLSIFAMHEEFSVSPAESLTARYQSYAIHD